MKLPKSNFQNFLLSFSLRNEQFWSDPERIGLIRPNRSKQEKKFKMSWCFFDIEKVFDKKKKNKLIRDKQKVNWLNPGKQHEVQKLS